MQTACWQLCFPIVLRELGTRHASPPRFDPVESVTPPHRLRLMGVSFTILTPNGIIERYAPLCPFSLPAAHCHLPRRRREYDQAEGRGEDPGGPARRPRRGHRPLARQ